MTDQIAVSEILISLIHRDQYLDTRAIAAVDFKDDIVRRAEFAGLLRKREAVIIAPRIYARRNPVGSLMMAQYGADDDFFEMPAPHLVAAAMTRQYGWRLAMPVNIARHVLGLADRPEALPEIPYDQPEIRHFPKVDLTLLPAPAELFELSAAGQCLRQGLPRDASAPGLEEIGEMAGAASISAAVFLDGLQADLAAGRLTEREILVANAIIANAGTVFRRAPREFVPPAADEMVATLEDWSESKRRDLVCLAARRVVGHPYLACDSLSRTSPLIWIDEALGYARTRSRLYRLGRKERC